MALTVSRTAEISGPPTTVHAVLRDLATYEEWMPIVSSVDVDIADHWYVELRVAIGPFARSKRLRMKRTTDAADQLVFSRSESEGRSHATWELQIELDASDNSTTVHASLHYEGKMWTPGPVEDALESGLDKGIVQLQEFVSLSM